MFIFHLFIILLNRFSFFSTREIAKNLTTCFTCRDLLIMGVCVKNFVMPGSSCITSSDIASIKVSFTKFIVDCLPPSLVKEV